MAIVADEVIFSKRKTISIEVKADGRLVLRVPNRTTQKRIAEVLEIKADWIRQARERVLRSKASRVDIVFNDGESLPLFGKNYPLRVVDKPQGGLVFEPARGFSLDKEYLDVGRQLLVGMYRLQTRQKVAAIAAQVGRKWGLSWQGIRITSAKTRWGSCSSKNSLNFSYRLALLPLDLVEYVVVHELAHTRHHDHSARFWSLVGEMMPDYQQRRKRLKEIARTLPEI